MLLAGLATITHCLADSKWFVRSWQTDDGLPNNYVTGIFQGPDGFLWVSTRGGVARFDGTRFMPFMSREENDDQGLRAVTPGTAGDIWLTFYRGPTIRLGKDFSRIPLVVTGLPTETPQAVVQDHENSIWLTYMDSVCRIKNGQLTWWRTNDGVPSSRLFNSMVVDRNGTLWLAKGGLVTLFRDGQFQPMGKYSRTRLTPSAAGGIWIAAGVHLFKCGSEGQVRDVGTFLPEGSHIAPRTMLEDHTGAVWIGTDADGLFRYDGNFEKIETSQAGILSLAEDREGNVWAGTEGGGLDRISPRGIRLEGLENGSSPMGIQSICEDGHGTLWGVTQNGLLVSRNDGRWQPALTNFTMADVVTCIAADNEDAVWIGTRDRRVYRWANNKLVDWDVRKGFAGHTVINLFAGSNGDVWIGEYGDDAALQCLRQGELHTIRVPFHFPGHLTAIAEDRSGRIHVATSAGTFWRVQNDQLVNENALFFARTNRTILYLYSTPDDALWIGFDGGGLGRIKNGHFSRINTGQGLYDNHISQIIADGEGCLWFGSSRGIFKVRQAKLEAALDGRGQVQSIHYGPNEGLFSSEANSANVNSYVASTALRDKDGRIWIPMRTGIAGIDPKQIHENPGPPDVLLTRLTVDGRTVAADGEIPQAGANPGTTESPLRLPPSHQRLEFQFTALNFTAPENVHLQYRLDGLDASWIDADAERHAEYSRLTAGNYVFHVRARNGDGDWAEAKTSLALVVQPFVWQTWWFRALAITVFTFFVIAGVRYISFRRLRLKLLALEQEAALNRERARIARDIHDDLGGNLTQVKQLFELTSRHRASPEQVHEFVQRGLTVTRQGVKSLDETVWAVNPRNDTLPDLINYIGQRTVEFLSTAGIQYHLDLPDHPPSRAVPAEARHNLFFVVKEALNNVVSHAHATEIWLNVAVDTKTLTVTIRDNGCGFENLPDNPCADGLRNMQQRMEMIKGRCDIESAPGRGTTLIAVYPWQ